MSVFEWISLALAIFGYVIAFGSVILSLRERVKRNEEDIRELKEAQKDATEKHELLAVLNTKLDMVIKQLDSKTRLEA
ncbi:hypothetical protein [Sulfurospirillum multivorans]|uniref:Membrane protein n=2 Tax=Sulfurospirillum multivorans TaxID=66821 RepID=A0AA86AIY6_SULMK|nr:hypothetical protein [Sulfurospirillum multivorans]AHJ11540.1 hypothetical protein SMUL_0258 [Sulfurospirillum multivorans DSM 12446]AHJ12347.1 putative membrane protein [Sulfurospirillum multivorans DSM 12446]QEH05845.1 putative membrane protein [Sulfurospirillum multivorans]